MISSETVMVFSKACELFILELSFKALKFALEAKRRTMMVKLKI